MLKLPFKKRVHFSVKWLLIAGGVLLTIVLGGFFLATGKWKALKLLMLKQDVRHRNHAIARLEAGIDANADLVLKENELQAKVEKERKRLEKERLVAELEIKEMPHEDIVAALRERGF